jgi:hypothetical protein
VAGPDDYYREEASGRIARWSFLGYRSVHEEMTANGDGGKPIWMTELGWSSSNGGPTSCSVGMWAGQKPSGVNEAAQAAFLTKAYACLANDPYVTDAQWFTMRDTTGASRDELDHYGLLRPDGSPKPALSAFRAVAAAGGGAAGPCGDFTPPTIRMVSPAPNQQFVDKIDVQAGAADAGVGMLRLSFTFDGGQKINTYGADKLAQGATVGLKPWYASGSLKPGAHTIEVTAVDVAGNTTTQTISVTKVKALPSTLLPVFKLKAKRVSCQRRNCRIAGSLLRGRTGGPTIGGHVAVEWQFLNAKRQWRKQVGGRAQARKPFAFKAKIRRAGKWRVRVVYQGQAPWKPTRTSFMTFKVL